MASGAPSSRFLCSHLSTLRNYSQIAFPVTLYTTSARNRYWQVGRTSAVRLSFQFLGLPETITELIVGLCPVCREYNSKEDLL
jgi:hypothetical protein